jgi:hypothetical protein
VTPPRKTPTPPAAPPRRGRQFQQAGAPLRPKLGVACARHGFAEPEVLLRWEEIVGAHLAPLCRPVKVVYGRSVNLGATLVVQTQGARATEVDHLAPRIVERVNQFYGYRAIARLRITQATGQAGQAQGFAEAAAGYAAPVVQPTEEPTDDARARAAEMTREIEDPDLRAAFTRLAARMLTTPPHRARPE